MVFHCGLSSFLYIRVINFTLKWHMWGKTKAKLLCVSKIMLIWWDHLCEIYGAVNNKALLITHQMQQQCWPKECFQCSDSHEVEDLCLPMGKNNSKMTYICTSIIYLDLYLYKYKYISSPYVRKLLKCTWTINISAVCLRNVGSPTESTHCLRRITGHSCAIHFHKPLTQLCRL